MNGSKLFITTLFMTAVPLLSIGCKTQKDIDKAVNAALDTQKAEYEQKMAEMQKANGATVAAKDKSIEALKTQVGQLGGDVSKAGTELASTKLALEASEKERDLLKKLREDAEREAAQFKEVSMKLKAMVDSGKLQVVNRKGHMTLKLPDNILFPSGSKQLKKEGKEALVSVAEVLKGVPDRDFIISGHTDNVPVSKSGPFKSNWELSTARAAEVVKLMIDSGVAPQHLSAAGFGEFDPVGDNTTDEGRKANRRLEIILMPKIEDVPQMPPS